jgi:hypothetical protein
MFGAYGIPLDKPKDFDGAVACDGFCVGDDHLMRFSNENITARSATSYSFHGTDQATQ